tara:strand:- start:1869 stop:2444 length:576 start_codon:yes stop_codon:yes gene_type:complete
MKIYFFGGSFDPPHRGHLSIIQSCITKAQKLILVPTNQSPLKKSIPAASAYHRMQMLKLLIKSIDFPISIDSWEMDRMEINYTYDTIKYLKKKYPDSKLFMVIGGDQMGKFNKWKNYKKIMDMVQLVLFKRPNYEVKMLKDMKVNYISDMELDISSSSIRRKINSGEISINDLNQVIINYIQDNNLYGYNT